jgi:hypothetical protein
VDAGPPPAPGAAVRIVTTKWGERPHWEFDGVFLGEDGFGAWVGFRAGTRFTRPGMTFLAEHDHVAMVPAHGRFLATFWPDGGPVEVYVDITDRPEWHGSTVRAVDLDLDVVRFPDGRVEVDDEDEFTEHQVTFGYPTEVVAAAETTCAAVLADVREGAAPYDAQTPTSWLGVLRSL